MRSLGPSSDRLLGGAIPARVGDKRIPSQVLALEVSVAPAAVVTPAGFLAGIPNRSPARARGLAPRRPY